MNYLAVKLDIVRSRKQRNRSELQKRLQKAVAECNGCFEESLVSKFIVTHGDEVQGMLDARVPEDVLDAVELLMEKLRPVELRFGVGFGTLATDVQEYAIGMDGEAWHRAKKAIDEAHARRNIIQFGGFGENRDLLLTALGNLLLFGRMRWTKEQLEAIRLLEEGKLQAEIARLKGISEAAVSSRLNNAGWRFYEAGRNAFQVAIAEAVAECQ